MANRKISDLTALTAPVTGDLLPIVDISEAAAADKNKKITYGTFLSSVPLGTAAAPSIAFTGDTNTGIYSPGADQVAIATGGTGRFFVDANGNVGVNTTTPGAALDVIGNADTVVLSSNATNSTTKEAKIQCRHYTNAEENLLLLYGFSTSADNAVILGGGSGSQNAATTVRFFTAADTTTTSGSERVRIDSSGRLLVGGSPDSGGALLQVFGDRIRVGTAKTPASASATGTAGEICWDASYIYVCTATNTWKRTAIATW